MSLSKHTLTLVDYDRHWELLFRLRNLASFALTFVELALEA